MTNCQRPNPPSNPRCDPWQDVTNNGRILSNPQNPPSLCEDSLKSREVERWGPRHCELARQKLSRVGPCRTCRVTAIQLSKLYVINRRARPPLTRDFSFSTGSGWARSLSLLVRKVNILGRFEIHVSDGSHRPASESSSGI